VCLHFVIIKTYILKNFVYIHSQERDKEQGREKSESTSENKLSQQLNIYKSRKEREREKIKRKSHIKSSNKKKIVVGSK